MARSGLCLRSPVCSPSASRRSSVSRPKRVLRRSVPCGHGSSGSRGTPPRSDSWRRVACRSAPTCARRFATSPRTSSPSSRRALPGLLAEVGALSASTRINGVLRSGILHAADSARVQRFMSKHGMRLGAARFVAGETLDECIATLRRLTDAGSPREHDLARRGREERVGGGGGRRELRGDPRAHRGGDSFR